MKKKIALFSYNDIYINIILHALKSFRFIYNQFKHDERKVRTNSIGVYGKSSDDVRNWYFIMKGRGGGKAS